MTKVLARGRFRDAEVLARGRFRNVEVLARGRFRAFCVPALVMLICTYGHTHIHA